VRAKCYGKPYALFAAFNFAGKCTINQTGADQIFGEKLEVLNYSAHFLDQIAGSL